MNPYRLLLIDDDQQALESTSRLLEMAGYSVVLASNGSQGLQHIRNSNAGGVTESFHAILSDVRMPKMTGFELIEALRVCGENTPVILMTAFGKLDEAVWAMKQGAVDFLQKPFKKQQLLEAVELAIKRRNLQEVKKPEVTPLKHTDRAEPSSEPILGTSPAMLQLAKQIEQVAKTPVTVLLHGESGTGKELFARWIHQLSFRNEKPFMALNCASVPESLIESELFGYEKGSFTGAQSARAGLFESAHQGTLLLDEVGDMPLSVQPSLLRVLQENEIRRLGASVSKKVDVRIIAATHRDLFEEVKGGRFREDLRYRLEVVVLKIPPLRSRPEDIPALCRAFVKKQRPEVAFRNDTLELLMAHKWPGNVRELHNVLERALVFQSGSLLLPSDLPPHIAQLNGQQSIGALEAYSSLKNDFLSAGAGGTFEVKIGTPLKEVEDAVILKTLAATGGDKEMTAKLLGINARTIYRRLEQINTGSDSLDAR